MNAVGAFGWCGAIALLSAYALLTLKGLTVRNRSYVVLNVTGSAALVVNGASHSAWPSVTLNLVWLALAGAGLVKTAGRSIEVGNDSVEPQR